MKLMVNGKIREISANKAVVLESQFEELRAALEKQGFTPGEWFRKAQRDDLAIGALKGSHLNHLATDIGIAFLKEKIKQGDCSTVSIEEGGCPLAPYRAH